MLNLKFTKNEVFDSFMSESTEIKIYIKDFNSTSPIIFLKKSTDQRFVAVLLTASFYFPIANPSKQYIFSSKQLYDIEKYFRTKNEETHETNWFRCFNMWRIVNPDASRLISIHVPQPDYTNMKQLKQNEDYGDLFLLRPNLSKSEMKKYSGIKIAVNPELDVLSPFFKIYVGKEDHVSESDYCIRVRFDIPKIIHYNLSVIPELNHICGDIKRKAFMYMSEQNTTYRAYSNWDVAKYKWNDFNGFIIESIDKYFNGDYDYLYADRPQYIPAMGCPRHIILS